MQSQGQRFRVEMAAPVASRDLLKTYRIAIKKLLVPSCHLKRSMCSGGGARTRSPESQYLSLRACLLVPGLSLGSQPPRLFILGVTKAEAG